MPALLSPSPYPSPGLLQAVYDVLGTSRLQEGVCGALDGAVYTTNGSYQFTITPPAGKGPVTWIRGVWVAAAKFSYYSLKAAIDINDTGTDHTNYLSTAVNNADGSTTVTCLSGIGVGTSVQVYYAREKGRTANKGEALGGWPYLHSADEEDNYGSANDGDMSTHQFLYYAFDALGEVQFKNLADVIGNALQRFEAIDRNKYTFDVSLKHQLSLGGMYGYWGNGTTWSWDAVADPYGITPGKVLRIITNLPSGTYGYGGFGIWPTRDNVISPVKGFLFDIYGDGSGRKIVISSNIDPAKLSSGDVVAGYPMLAADANKWVTVALTLADFWKVANLVYNGERKNYYWESGVSHDTYTTASLADVVVNDTGAWGARQYTVKRFSWVGQAGSHPWANVAIGVDPAVSSAGTPGLNIDLRAAMDDPTVTISIKDSATPTPNVFTHNVVMSAGWTKFSIPWATFGAVVHPITEIHFDISGSPTVNLSGHFDFNNISFGDIVTAASLNPTVINGFQLAFGDYGSYDVCFDNIVIDQQVIDPFPGLPRYTDAWVQLGGKRYGKGTWAGQTAAGYLWAGGWARAGGDMGARIIKFMRAAQDDYEARFPSAVPGPFMVNYGRWGWEAISDGHLNQFYFSGTDNWAPYVFRALASVANYYYLTGDGQAKVILDKWMTWLDKSDATGDATPCGLRPKSAALGYGTGWTAPSNFNDDGSLTYGYFQIYVHAMIAEACAYKYWRDGDAIALKWNRRCLDDIHAKKITSALNGQLANISAIKGGRGYSYANIAFTCDGTPPTATCIVSGGMVRGYNILTRGSGNTYITAAVTGDGSGAECLPYLYNKLVGAYNEEHAGYEIAQIGVAFGMLVNGRPGVSGSGFGVTFGTLFGMGAVGGYGNDFGLSFGTDRVSGDSLNYPLGPGVNDTQDFTDLAAFVLNNASDTRPSMLSAAKLPMHEWTYSSWHKLQDDPMVDDTHADGMSWTEDLGPFVALAVDIYRHSADRTLLDVLTQLIYELVSPRESVIMGQLSDGSMAVNVAKPFCHADTEDEDALAFSSKFNTLKIMAEGSWSVTTADLAGGVTGYGGVLHEEAVIAAHSLGYAPSCMVTMQMADAWGKTYTQLPQPMMGIRTDPSNGLMGYRDVSFRATTTGIVLTSDYYGPPGTAVAALSLTGRYFIFVERGQA